MKSKLVFPRTNERRNGVTKPYESTTTGYIWSLLDRYRRQHEGRLPTSATLWQLFSNGVEGASLSTMQTQYSRYVRFYGLKAEQEAMRDAQRSENTRQRNARRQKAAGA